MRGVVLGATTSTDLGRTTVHEQYTKDRKAVGLFVANMIVPISFRFTERSGIVRNGIIVIGKKAHKESPYKDYGVRKKCCKKVIKFNINHYIKCYLPTAVGSDGTVRTPFTFNRCQKCNEKIVDDCGHIVQMVTHREYNVNKFIFRTSKVVQACDGPANIFNHQTQVCSNCIRSGCNGC